jgi:zinc protease
VGAAEPPKPGVYLIDRPGSIQSLILMGTVAPPRANPEEIPEQVMNTILGGQFISRVNMNLREDKHWSYGAGTVLLDARGPRPYLGYAQVQGDKTSEALAEFAKELTDLQGPRPATPQELQVAQSSLTLALPGEWETSRAVAASLQEIVRFGFPDRYFDGWAGRVNAVTTADVSKAATLVAPSRVLWVVVGDRAKVEAGLEKLGLGPVQVIDANGAAVAARR